MPQHEAPLFEGSSMLHRSLVSLVIALLCPSAPSLALSPPEPPAVWEVTDPGALVPAPLDGVMLLLAARGGVHNPVWQDVNFRSLIDVDVTDPSGQRLAGTGTYDLAKNAFVWRAAGSLAPSSRYAVEVSFAAPHQGPVEVVRFAWVTESATSPPPTAERPVVDAINFQFDCSTSCCVPRLMASGTAPPLSWLEARVEALGEVVSVDVDVPLDAPLSTTALAGFGTGPVCVTFVGHSYVDDSTVTSEPRCADPFGNIAGVAHQELCAIDADTGDIIRRRWVISDVPDALYEHGGAAVKLGFFDPAVHGFGELPADDIEFTVRHTSTSHLVPGSWHLEQANQLLIWQADAPLVEGDELELEVRLTDRRAPDTPLVERLVYTVSRAARSLTLTPPSELVPHFKCQEGTCCSPVLLVMGAAELELGQFMEVTAADAAPHNDMHIHADRFYSYQFVYDDVGQEQACFTIRGHDVLTGSTSERFTCFPDPFAELRKPQKSLVFNGGPVPATIHGNIIGPSPAPSAFCGFEGDDTVGCGAAGDQRQALWLGVALVWLMTRRRRAAA